jgi:outer membrane protein TolC
LKSAETTVSAVHVHIKELIATKRLSPCVFLALISTLIILTGCTPQRHRAAVDRDAYAIIAQKQREAFGETNAFSIDSAAVELRERLLLGQDLPRTGPESLGVTHLEPVAHWPDDDYLVTEDAVTALAGLSNATVALGLFDALKVAARNSRQYQSSKESVFRSALALHLERDEFRATFAGLLSGQYVHDRSGLAAPGGELTESLSADALASVSRRFQSGAQMTLRLGWDVIRLLEPERLTSDSFFGDASISIPLLRGAGRHIAAEPLTQAERDVVYALYNFEEFKRSFAVQIASSYLSVLQRENEVQNVEENYRGLIASTRRARRLLDAGNLPAIQVDQSIQDELSARNRWVSARESYAGAMDAFKLQLGLPADSRIALDIGEFEQLSTTVSNVLHGATAIEYGTNVPPADAAIVLEEPSNEYAGPLELAPLRAIRLALANRLDLRIAQGTVRDALRGIVVAADRLKADVTLFGGARFTAADVSDFSLDTGSYDALLNINLPFERTAEAVAYRNSYITLQQTVRDLQELEDEIKLAVMNRLRELREARESLRIQALSVELARRRVRGANLNLQAGRVEIRDLLEAQEDLLSAQNSLTAAKVNYRVAEWELQRDLGLLQVNPNGLWTEYQPERNENETTIN